MSNPESNGLPYENANGWMGVMSHVLHALRVVGADQDERGDFLVRGTIATFMGMAGENADVVVGGDAAYRVGGQWASLAGLMNATSYGVRRVTVI